MGDSVDQLIDLNSPILRCQRASLIPSVPVPHQSKPETQTLLECSPLADNNPFDLLMHQTEINEADKNDPFEMAFVNAYRHKQENKNLDASQVNEADTNNDPFETVNENAYGLKQENKNLDASKITLSKAVGCTEADSSYNDIPQIPDFSDSFKAECLKEKISEKQISEEMNLDNIQPPDSLLNLSLELSETSCNITISDTLHLSDMNDTELNCSFPVRSQTVHNAALTEDNALLSDEGGSFEESPVKALKDLNSEESVKALIENRIKKCIAKALNDSHQQLKNTTLSGNGDRMGLQTSLRESRGSLRASLSVPQNLNLLQDVMESWQTLNTSHLMTACENEKNIQDLQIPFLDQNLLRKEIGKDPQASAKTSTGNLGLNLFANEQPEADKSPEQKSYQLTNLVFPTDSVHGTDAASSVRRSSLKTVTGSGLKSHRRSLSCDVIPSAQIAKGKSPPKLPPLPLSSDTIRDLSLCSKHSPPKVQERNHSPGDIPTKLNNRVVPLPVCAQPKLVLRKKQNLAINGGTVDISSDFSVRIGKGPMKATLPLQNMTKVVGSPPAQPQSRKTVGTPRRMIPQDSPSFQKTKLCPLAASTPSSAAVPDDAAHTRTSALPAQQPRRILASGIPSPRKGCRVTSASNLLPATSSIQILRNAPQSAAKPDTPTKRASPSLQRRGATGNPRVLIDRNNGFSSPTVTPIRKVGVQGLGSRLRKTHPSGMGKENIVHP